MIELLFNEYFIIEGGQNADNNRDIVCPVLVTDPHFQYNCLVLSA